VNGRADTLLPADLPSGRALLERGRRLGETVDVGLSLLCEEHGVRSELAYKRKAASEGRLMTTMNIGLQTWADTARALERIHAETQRRGFRIDRYQMQLDRRMGVPAEDRARAAKETGPLLESDADWQATTRTVPIQPGLGDMMIGSPMSVGNARQALEAGVTYIGNMSQFAWKYPSWRGTDVDQMVEMTTALGLMASKNDDDAVVQSYLDDGYPAQFSDFCSYVGWAMFERYLVNEVIGARLAISYGGLTHDPIMKTAMILALEAITPEGTCNPFYHCNTTAYVAEIDRNYGTLGVDVLYLMATQSRLGSGAAVLPIPVTEALRIPSWREIVEVHAIARRIAEYAPQVADHLDWPRLEHLRDNLLDGGRRFCDRLLDGLDGLGVDLVDPLQLLLAVRRLGAVEIERRFGSGTFAEDQAGEAGYEPLIPTDTLKDFLGRRSAVHRHFSTLELRAASEESMVVASTDVHEYGMRLVTEALVALGIEPIMAGTGVDPDELADLALEAGASAVLVSTHNGMALTYAEQLLQELGDRRLAVEVLFGGTLNQDLEGTDVPVDVRDELRGLGIHVCEDVLDIVTALGLELGGLTPYQSTDSLPPTRDPVQKRSR
jgi:hypothetical protein